MKTRMTLLVSLVIALLAACTASTPPAPTSTSAPPTTAVPTSEPTTGAAVEPTAEPAASPVEFVWQVTGGDDPLYWPSGLALDLDGSLYVADTRNHRILKYDGDGQLLATLGREGSGDGEFNFVWGDPNHNLPGAGLAVDGQGNLFVTDMGNVRVQKSDREGNFLAQWGSSGTGEGQFVRPFDLAVDAQGNVYVIDDRTNPRGRIQKFDGDGNFLASFGQGLFSDPGGIALDAQGSLYVSDVDRGTILKLDNHGALLATWGGQGTGDGQFRGPLGLDVDAAGNLYVVDSLNGRIQKLDGQGRYLFQWGTRGSEAGQFNEACCIRVDDAGAIYVGDQFNNRIQKFRQAADTAAAATIEPIVFAEAPCCTGTPLQAGLYRTPDWHPIPFTVTVGDGWRSIVEEEFNAIGLVRGLSAQNRPTQWLQFMPIPDDMPGDVVWETLRSTGGLVVGEDTDVTIAGLPGRQFEAAPETENKNPGSHLEIPIITEIIFPDTVYHFETERLDVGLRFILIPVANQNMLIYMEAPQDEFETFAGEADQVLETLQLIQAP